MATTKQVRAAKRNVKKAQSAAVSKRTIAHMPAKTRTALGKQGAAVARRKRTCVSSPKTRRGAVRGGQAAQPPRPIEDGPRQLPQPSVTADAPLCRSIWAAFTPFVDVGGARSEGNVASPR